MPRRPLRLEGAVFYSDVRDLIQTVVLPDTTTQTQNVGDGRFYGVEVGVDVTVGAQLTVGGNYTALSRTIRDALLPNLQPTGVPTHKAFLYAAWQPVRRLTITPSLDVAGDRWSEVNPAAGLPLRPHRLVHADRSLGAICDRRAIRRGGRAEEPARRGLSAGLGLPATWPHVLREDSSRALMAGEGIMTRPASFRAALRLLMRGAARHAARRSRARSCRARGCASRADRRRRRADADDVHTGRAQGLATGDSRSEGPGWPRGSSRGRAASAKLLQAGRRPDG